MTGCGAHDPPMRSPEDRAADVNSPTVSFRRGGGVAFTFGEERCSAAGVSDCLSAACRSGRVCRVTSEAAAGDVLGEQDGVGPLIPTGYLREMAALLRSTEPELWSFFDGASTGAEQATAARAQLLQHSVRLATEDYPELHSLVARAAAVLGVFDPVTLYQAQAAGSLPDHGNASCLSLLGEVHMVFSGRLLEQLDEQRLLAVIGHELTHHKLWQDNDGELGIAERMLWAAAVDGESLPSHAESARRFRLHVEITADRGGLAATDDLTATVEALVSVATGLANVSGASYLKQAIEVLAAPERDRSGDGLHPELYIRARALELWATEPDRLEADRLIADLLRSEDGLDGLDLLDQHHLTDVTRRLVGQAMREPFLRTDATLSQAGLFGAASVDGEDEALSAQCRALPPAIQEYLAAVLLDIATCDPDIDEVALAQTLVLADRVGLGSVYEPLAAKELGIGIRTVRARRAAAPALLERAAR